MTRKVFILLLLIAITYSVNAQQQNDSVWAISQWRSFIDAIRADSTDMAQQRLNNTIESFKEPLYHALDTILVNKMHQRIQKMVNDSTIVLSSSQRKRVEDIKILLTSYTGEAQRMILAFNTQSSSLSKKTAQFSRPENDGVMVSAFCRGQFSQWYQESDLPTFALSKIPFLRQKVQELDNILADLCNEQKASPELLRKFMEIEFTISTTHRAVSKGSSSRSMSDIQETNL